MLGISQRFVEGLPGEKRIVDWKGLRSRTAPRPPEGERGLIDLLVTKVIDYHNGGR